MTKQSEIGMIGLAVMGENLARNMASRGYKVAGYDIDASRVKAVNHRFGQSNLQAFDTLEAFLASLQKPKVIMMMIKAGKPVDETIAKLLPFLEKGDIIIDGGNSLYKESMERYQRLESLGMHFLGMGISGGEEGALRGPSIMPGGSMEAWNQVKPLFQSIAAKTADGFPCCDWVGTDGAGHFVKMVHNGIEYGDLQLINEVYDVMKRILQLSNPEMADLFKQWNQEELESYLIEITGDILSYQEENGSYLVDSILDTAGQKGTGKWTAIASMEEGVPLSLITEAVYARMISSQKDQRVQASIRYPKTKTPFTGDKQAFLKALKDALYSAKILSYAQGYLLLKKASETYSWNLDFGGIALLWQGGCIIRSVFLNRIKEAFTRNPNLENLLLDDYFHQEIVDRIQSLRDVLIQAIQHQIPTPSLSSALAYFDGYTSNTLPANLLQAQRDYFGAHNYERVDQPRGVFFHTKWTTSSGDTASNPYQE